MWTNILALFQSINPYSAISFASMFISLLAFIASQLAARRREGGDYIQRLETRVETLKRNLCDAEARIEMQREQIVTLNAALTRRILDNEKTN